MVGNNPSGNFPGGNFPGGNFPRTLEDIRSINQKHCIIQIVLSGSFILAFMFSYTIFKAFPFYNWYAKLLMKTTCYFFLFFVRSSSKLTWEQPVMIKNKMSIFEEILQTNKFNFMKSILFCAWQKVYINTQILSVGS